VLSRRRVLTSGACILAAPFINRGRFRLFAQSETEYSAVTVDLIRDSTVIDMLGLLTLDWGKLSAWRSKPETFLAADLQRLKDSGITVFHPAVGYTNAESYGASLADITGWNSFIASHNQHFLRVDGPADLEQAKSLGKIGIVIGQQNSNHFRMLDDVDRFYKLGQRVSQLTYLDNRIGGGSTDARETGLTEYGRQVIERMNTLGMAVDISHCGDRTTLEAIETSSKPVLITHSNCRALVPGSARCKTDTAIRKMAAKGGVMGITLIRYFVSAANSVTIENVLNHVDRVAHLAGAEHVGLGTDVDLAGRDLAIAPRKKDDLDGLDYTRKIFDLTEGLVQRSYSKSNIELILGGNFRRALSSIWTT
jgi:membrane dipeptidase